MIFYHCSNVTSWTLRANLIRKGYLKLPSISYLDARTGGQFYWYATYQISIDCIGKDKRNPST